MVRTVLVTGGLGAIGMATAREFARSGDALVIVDRAADPVAAAKLVADGAVDAISIACDVADEAAVVAAVAAALSRLGRIDVIVNVAGAMLFKNMADWTAREWHELLGVNLVGAAMFVREGFRHMTDGGAIVNVASVHARRTSAQVAPYAAAKAALVSLTRSAAIEGKPRGIRVNAVLPGAIDTPMLWNSDAVRSGAEVIDPADIGQPEDVARLVHFLASDAACFITGEDVVADGGRMGKL